MKTNKIAQDFWFLPRLCEASIRQTERAEWYVSQTKRRQELKKQAIGFNKYQTAVILIIAAVIFILFLYKYFIA